MWTLTSASWTVMGPQRKLERFVMIRLTTSTSWTTKILRHTSHRVVWALQVSCAAVLQGLGLTKCLSCL